jgi:hypothetical protein
MGGPCPPSKTEVAPICLLGNRSSSDSDFALVRYESSLVLEILINIKPGSDTNPINPKSHRKLPAAILTTESFDAATVAPERPIRAQRGEGSA